MSKEKTIFDGMEDFESSEKIGMEILKELEEKQHPIYSEEDFEEVKRIINKDS